MSSGCRLRTSFAQPAKFLNPLRHHDTPIPMLDDLSAPLRSARLHFAGIGEDFTHALTQMVYAGLGPSVPGDQFVFARRGDDPLHRDRETIAVGQKLGSAPPIRCDYRQ